MCLALGEGRCTLKRSRYERSAAKYPKLNINHITFEATELEL
jgi:hypothetical protein